MKRTSSENGSPRKRARTGGSFEGQSVVVTGGAGGIGKVIALEFAQEGAYVVILDVTNVPREGGDTTVEAAAKLEASVEYVEGTVTSMNDVQAAVSRAVAATGRLDVFVNNAAIGTDKALLETTEEEWDKVMGVNAKGVFLGCKAAIGQMITQDLVGEERGRVVNISSQHGMVCAPGDLAYGAGKSCVVYMTKQIAADYAKHGIIVNAVAPGKIVTGKAGPAASAESLALSHTRTPWPRLGLPHDVAKAVLFLSGSASFVVGHNLMVDGGWMAA